MSAAGGDEKKLKKAATCEKCGNSHEGLACQDVQLEERSTKEFAGTQSPYPLSKPRMLAKDLHKQN